MKKTILIGFLTLLFSLLLICTAAAQTDGSIVTIEPGVVGEVIECGPEITLAIQERPTLAKSLSSRTAVDQFLYFKLELIYYSDTYWDALDRSSFELVTTIDGQEQSFPLDLVGTIDSGRRMQINTPLDELVFPSKYTYNLVFDVPAQRDNWMLHYRLKERGSEDGPVCDLTTPLPRTK